MIVRPQLYGIVGEDISYSLSPAIYNELFRRYLIEATYVRFDLPARQLAAFLTAARHLPLSGFNVTIPHKEAIASRLDRRDAMVAATGATNLVLVKNRQLRGYNTDYEGIRATIEDRLEIDVSGKSALLIGSGGVARTVIHYLSRRRVANVVVAMRNSARSRRFRLHAARIARSTAVEFSQLENLNDLGACAICVNCTPVSTRMLLVEKMKGFNGVVFDLSYTDDNPMRSRRYSDGKFMLAAQAASNFKMMTGITVATGDVLQIIRKALAR